jgi:hypothetical protein
LFALCDVLLVLLTKAAHKPLCSWNSKVKTTRGNETPTSQHEACLAKQRESSSEKERVKTLTINEKRLKLAVEMDERREKCLNSYHEQRRRILPKIKIQQIKIWILKDKTKFARPHQPQQTPTVAKIHQSLLIVMF